MYFMACHHGTGILFVWYFCLFALFSVQWISREGEAAFFQSNSFCLGCSIQLLAVEEEMQITGLGRKRSMSWMEVPE